LLSTVDVTSHLGAVDVLDGAGVQRQAHTGSGALVDAINPDVGNDVMGNDAAGTHQGEQNSGQVHSRSGFVRIWIEVSTGLRRNEEVVDEGVTGIEDEGRCGGNVWQKEGGWGGRVGGYEVKRESVERALEVGSLIVYTYATAP
jgi:hypothetical protein